MKRSLAAILLAPLVLTACATTSSAPPSPRVVVMPGPKKSLAAFDNDERRCRDWADRHIDETPGEAADNATARGAVAGTLLGAGAGAAIGSTSGHVGDGALVGAASGLLLGTLAGASSGQRSAASVQRSYDIAYAQCMTAAGNTVEAPPRRDVVVIEERPSPPVVVYGGPFYHSHYRRW